MQKTQEVGNERGAKTLFLTIALVITIIVVLTFVFQDQLGDAMSGLGEIESPSAVQWASDNASNITYISWAVMAVTGLALVGLYFSVNDWQTFLNQLARFGIIESAKEHDIKHGLRIAAEMGGIAAFCWAVLSPIPIVPGAIHFREFAGVPIIAALVFGRMTGFITGWVGSVAWALVAGYWIADHTPLVDGVAVGLFTGMVPGLILRGRKSRTELLAHIQQNRVAWYIKSAAVTMLFGLLMAFFVGASLQHTTGGGVPFWVGFFTIGVVSDTIPIMLAVAFVTEPLLKLTAHRTELPDF